MHLPNNAERGEVLSEIGQKMADFPPQLEANLGKTTRIEQDMYIMTGSLQGLGKSAAVFVEGIIMWKVAVGLSK